MADIYSKVEAYNAVGGNDAGATVGANSRKTKHDTFNYGTPAIYPIVVVRTDEGNFTGHASSGSDFQKVVAVIQTRAEIYGIGEVDGTEFSVFVNWNTTAQDDGEYEPNYLTQLDYLEAEILAATGITARVDAGKIVGQTLANNC
jgi:hypothetical protein